MTDQTSKIEQMLLREQRPGIRHLVHLFLYVFRTTKVISTIYLGLFICLSLLRPVAALVWGRYLEAAENAVSAETLLGTALLLTAYFLIDYLADLLESYVALEGGGDLEQLDLVQANHQQELLKSKLLRKLGRISPECFEAPKMNDRIQQVFDFATDSWNGLNRQVMLSSYAVIAKLISLISIAATLYLFNGWLCLLVVLAPLLSLSRMALQEKLQFTFEKDTTRLRREIQYFQELLLSGSAREIRVYGLHDFFYRKWKKRVDSHRQQQQKLIRTRCLLQMENTLLANLINIGGIVLAVLLLSAGKLSLGALAAVFSLIGTVVSDAYALISSLAALLSKKYNAAQFFDLMDLPEDAESPKSNDAAGQRAPSAPIVEAKGLRYRYPFTEKYVLDGVDLQIAAGEKVAFVGENGAGKSTFVKLMEGLLSPSEGELLFRGAPDPHWDAQSTVPQKPTRYETFTVADNVFLGDTGRPRDGKKLTAALHFAGLDLPEDLMLGKGLGGSDLSGGQWQKLAIARATYRRKDFILLDEPTSNLDPISETEIFQKYLALSQNRTVVYVTHRISVAALADRIIVFRDGKICQDGTHRDLMQQDGEYRRLYTEQAKWYKD